MTTMNKTIIIHHLNDLDNLPKMERWFVRDHCPEVLAQAPWLTRYVMYRTVPPAKGMESMGYMNYRVHVNMAIDKSFRRNLRGLLCATQEPVENAMTVAVANVPAEPTEDFCGQQLGHYDTSFIRFLYFFSYPERVDKKEGEDWFLNVHAPEVCKLPGVLRFFSSKSYDEKFPPLPMPEGMDNLSFVDLAKDNLLFHSWDRVCEIWFENNSAWTEAFVENGDKLTAPGWATTNAYPFVVPGKDFICTSILERPDQDMLKHYEGYIL